jgi:hypothetical protein
MVRLTSLTSGSILGRWYTYCSGSCPAGTVTVTSVGNPEYPLFIGQRELYRS